MYAYLSIQIDTTETLSYITEMRTYRIGMWAGDPFVCEEEGHWHYDYVHDINAESLKEAILEWAKVTGYDKNPLWNESQCTYWGFEVEEVRNRCGLKD